MVTNHIILSYCRLCEAGCGVRVELNGGVPVGVEPDREHVVTKGFFCTKGKALAELVTDPRRLLAPRRRAHGDPIGKFTDTTWEEAYDSIAARISNIIKMHGPDAVAFYHGNPTAFSWAATISNAALARVIGSGRFYTAGTIDCAERFVLSEICYGHPLYVTIPDLKHSHFALLLGANPAVSTWAQLTSIPRWREEVAAMRARGGKFVVIDPRRTETAEAADLYISIRPGSDADLLLAMVNVILNEGLENKRCVADRLLNFNDARKDVSVYTVERAAARTGIDKNIILQLARDFAAAPSGFAAGHSGLTMQSRGSLAEWAIILLNAVCGRIDARGGLLYNPGIINIAKLSAGLLDRSAPLPAGTPPATRRILDDLPCAGLAPAIESGHVKALVIVAGNPLITFPNPGRLARAVEKLELIVAIDPYMNETGARAHYVLPTPSMLEREDCVLLNSSFLLQPYAQWTPAACAAPPGVRSEWEIAAELAKRLRGTPLWNSKISIARKFNLIKTRLLSRWILSLGEKRALRIMLTLFGKAGLQKLKKHPHGLLLGELKPGELSRRLKTPGRRIRIFTDEIARILKLDEENPPAGDSLQFPMILISRRRRGGMNSWLNHLPSSRAVDPNAIIEISPSDAQKYHIRDGEPARVEGAHGHFVAIAKISDRVPAGIASATHSCRAGDSTSHFNCVVGDARLDPLTGMPEFNNTPVRILGTVLGTDPGTELGTDPVCAPIATN